jgi:replication factor C subunit 2/4
VQEIAGVVPDSVILGFARTLGLEVSGGEGMQIDDHTRPKKAGAFDAVKKSVKDLMLQGYSASQTLSQVR